jgi:hypothetical protein
MYSEQVLNLWSAKSKKIAFRRTVCYTSNQLPEGNLRHRGSGVEQLTRNEQVVSSNLTGGYGIKAVETRNCFHRLYFFCGFSKTIPRFVPHVRFL